MKNLNNEYTNNGYKNIKRDIVNSLVLFMFSSGSLLLSIWIGNSMAILFDSVLDKYLNYTISMLYLSAAAINRIFFVIFLILFVVSIIKLIKHKKVNKNIIQIISILMFITVNIVFFVIVITSQTQETQVVDSIPVKSYVDIRDVFEISSNDESYREQTNYGKVNYEIPVNYEVQQVTTEYSVKTSCIKITDNELLYKYYEEQKERYSEFEPEDFNESQLNEISAEIGCFWSEDESSLNILIVKDNKVFQINVVGADLKNNYKNKITTELKAL